MTQHVLKRWTQSSPALTRLARRSFRWIPNVPVTRAIPGIGPFRFGIRRHRWMLRQNCLAGHMSNLTNYIAMIREGGVVYDIGANIGYYARYLLANAPVGQLVAFEPMSANFALLKHNIALSRHGDRCRILQMALADREGDELLQVDDVAGGSAVLDAVSGGSPAEARRTIGLGPKTEAVPVRPLDRVIDTERLPRPQFIKIDTEGAELDVLRGAERTLREDKPRLAIAVHGFDSAVKTLEFLEAMGYRSFAFTVDRAGKTCGRITPATVQQISDNNIYALHEDDVFDTDCLSKAK